MKSKFREYYNPNFEELWSKCTFVFDTNVLLNLYRMNDESKDAFLDVMKQVKERIWIPYQVGLEYHKNRVDVINEIKNNAEKLKDDINKDIDNLRGKLNKLFKQTKNAEQDKKSTTKILEEAESIINKSIDNSCKKAVDKTKRLLQEDKIQQKLTGLFRNKIGEEYTKDKLRELYKIAEERYKEKIPPGFKDTDKPNYEKYSDYIIWSQMLEYAASKKSCIIFITGDEKEDWWHIKSGKKNCHPQLKKEFYKTVGQEFHMYTPERFIDFANKYLGTNYSDKVIDEVKSIRSPYLYKDEDNYYYIRNDFVRNTALEQLFNDIVYNRDNLPYQIRTLADMCKAPISKGIIDFIFEIRSGVANNKDRKFLFIMFKDFVRNMLDLNKNIEFQIDFNNLNSIENKNIKENNDDKEK